MHHSIGLLSQMELYIMTNHNYYPFKISHNIFSNNCVKRIRGFYEYLSKPMNIRFIRADAFIG